VPEEPERAARDLLSPEDEGIAAPAPASVQPVPAANAPLLTVDEAKAKLGPEILDKLDRKFKGKVAGVRQPDTRDLLF